ncbi:MAG: acetate--CoA ligase family protein [Patescibacteria group bacterium]
MKLYSLLNPKSVAIIGASDQVGKIGNILVKNLIEYRYQGRIFPVNPKYQEIMGLKCFGKITEIQQEIDLVVVAIPAKLVYDAISEASGRSRNFIVISAGFSETGTEGKELENKLKELAKSRELNILGPNCLGLLNPALKLNASFSDGMPPVGQVAFVSQSGALAVALLDQAKERKLGFSKVVSLGNKMQIGENELLEFLGEDEETKVIGLYLESLEEGNNLLRLVGEVSKLKPVVVLKAGKSQRAKEAMLSHTASLAGEAVLASAALRKAGAIEVETISEFISLLETISKNEKLEKPGAVIVTNAGGPGVLATDAFENSSLSLVSIPEEIQKELKTFLPGASSLGNPIDLLGDALEDRYQKTLEALEKEENVGIILALITPQDQTPVKKIGEALLEFSKKSQKVIVPVFIGGEKVLAVKKFLCESGMSVFDYPEEAIEALDRYYRWKKSEKFSFQISEINQERKSSAQRIIEGARTENRKMLNAFEAQEILSLYEVPTAETFSASSSDFEFPVVLKVDSEKYVHKTDEGGVVIGIQNQEALNREIEKMREKFSEVPLIIQKQEPKGEELILGIKKDPAFGQAAVYGLGGIFTEVFQKVDFVFSGASEEAIRSALLTGPLEFMFQEFRGMKPLNLAELARILKKMSELAEELPEIKEMDINPLFGFRATGKFIAVDTKIII